MNREKLKEYLGFKSRIFPEKGANRECYDTRMLYEINEYLENASDNTFDKVYEYMDKKLEIAIDALEDIRNNSRFCDTNHSNKADDALIEIKEI